MREIKSASERNSEFVSVATRHYYLGRNGPPSFAYVKLGAHFLDLRGLLFETRARLADIPFWPLRSESREDTQLNHDIPLRAMIIREICSQPVGQGRCELVVYVVSEKQFPIAAYRALESSDCHRSHACVFVWAYLKIDFAKRLDFLKRGRINVEESAGGDLSYIRSPRNGAC